MKPFINWLIFGLTKGILVLLAACATLKAIILFSSILFNFHPYFRLDKETEIGFLEYKKGIPFTAHVNTEIPDSSIGIDNGSGIGLYNFFTGERNFLFDNRTQAPPKYSDAIRTSYEISNSSGIVENARITGSQLNTVTLYLRPRSFIDKVLFSLPGILFLLIGGYCCWQLAMLLDSIYGGKSFHENSYRRLLKIGWAILIADASLMLIGVFQRFQWIRIVFTSTIDHYRVPFETVAYPNSYFNFIWLIVGCLILVFAKAFQKGNQLEKDQELTV